MTIPEIWNRTKTKTSWQTTHWTELSLLVASRLTDGRTDDHLHLQWQSDMFSLKLSFLQLSRIVHWDEDGLECRGTGGETTICHSIDRLIISTRMDSNGLDLANELSTPLAGPETRDFKRNEKEKNNTTDNSRSSEKKNMDYLFNWIFSETKTGLIHLFNDQFNGPIGRSVGRFE